MPAGSMRLRQKSSQQHIIPTSSSVITDKPKPAVPGSYFQSSVFVSGPGNRIFFHTLMWLLLLLLGNAGRIY